MKYVFRSGLLTIAVSGFLASSASAIGSSRGSSETLAEDLMAVEVTAIKKVPNNASALLREALKDGEAAAAAAAPRPPRTREEALAVLKAIQEAMGKRHFVQPIEKEDWPDTMGEALTIRATSPPLYYVDCDMGAQLFISIGQRHGWDLRLVEANEDHLFLRWHMPGGEVVNWDWSRGQSFDDDFYLASSSIETEKARARYLTSLSLEEARAYYTIFIATHADDAAAAERLFKEAEKKQSKNPKFLNNFGWFYATHPGVSDEKRALGVEYALAGLSYKPKNPNRLDTVACAFAAAGDRARALVYEDQAIQLDPNNAVLRRNRTLIAEGKRCST